MKEYMAIQRLTLCCKLGIHSHIHKQIGYDIRLWILFVYVCVLKVQENIYHLRTERL